MWDDFIPVQEARTAAEKAEALAVVEAYVERAVVLAMRSAMAARVIAVRAKAQGAPPVMVLSKY